VPPASPFATGDDVVHLDKGLARIVEIKHSAGSLHLVVGIGKTTLWVPLSAWREHLRALPTRAEAEKWRVRATTGPTTAGGVVEATRRRNTLDHRNFAAKLDAFADSYRSGDRSQKAMAALEDMEDALLPILARSLRMTTDALRAELRAAMPEEAPPQPKLPLPDLGASFEPIGRATLGTKTVAGAPGRAEVALATLPGVWLGYRWLAHASDEFGRLVAVHADHVGQVSALLAARSLVGSPNCDAASALVYDPAILDDPAAVDEIYDPVEPGLIAGRGFLLSLGGDGPYDVAAAKHGSRVACIVAGEAVSELEARLLRGEDREQVVIDELARWKPDEDRDFEPVPRAALAILAEPPASPAKLAALEQFIARLDGDLEAEVDADRGLLTDAIEVAALQAPDRWFERLVAEFERPAPGLVFAIARVLVATRNHELGDLVLAKLATDEAPWRAAQLTLLRALVRAGHPGAGPALHERLAWASSPWARASTAAALLEVEPTSCELARVLIEHLETYGEQDRSGDPPHAGYGNDWDEVCEAMARHVTSCEACRGDWVTQLFRAKRADVPEMRRLVVIAPEQLAALTGAHTDDELWAWLAARRN